MSKKAPQVSRLTAQGAKPKTVKTTGKAAAAAANSRANGKAKKQADLNLSFDLEHLDELAEELLGDKKKLTAAQKVQRKKLEEYLAKELGDSDESCEDDSDEEQSGDGSDGDSADSNDYTEYTLNVTSPSSSDASPPPSAKGAPKSVAARPTDRKRSHLLMSDAASDDNNNKPAAARRVSPAPAAAAAPRKQRRSLEQTEPVNKPGVAPYCPLVVRKSLPASTAAKSCPLPENRKSLPPGEPNSCPLPPKKTKVSPRVDNDRPSTSKEVKQEPKEEAPKEVHKTNSIEEGRRILQWIINPVKPDDFFSDFWEKNACLVQRKNPKFFSELISFQMIDEMLIRHHLEFTTNIDVTSYTDGKRETLNPEGRAKPPTVWGFYGDGCSIRILNPSTYLAGLRQVCSMLQEFFHCLVGANVYLTPPNSQGFAPHYDDIEAFVLQVEGRKRWRLYRPLQPADVLARESSGNYSQEQLGEPILDEVLEAGDILYFPRGTVHQAITDKDQHSLHITLSVYQQQAYANLMEQLMPHVLQRAVKQSLTMRRGLPLHTWQNLGLVHGGTQSRTRGHLIRDVQEMVQKYLVPTETEIDWAVDQVAKKFQHEALPPTILPEEKVRTVFGSSSGLDAKGYSLCDYELTDQTSIRLLRANILRLVANEGSLRIYFYVDNALEYCKYEANFMEIEAAEAGAVETLIKAYPAYIKVSLLPLKSADRRIEVATALWERGLLMTEKPFK